MSNKYKAPENPYDKFESDIARELTAKNFAIKVGNKKDSKVYRTLAYVIGHKDDCPVFKACNKDYAWIWTYHGSGIGLDIVSEGIDSLIYQGPTWTVRDIDNKNIFKKENEIQKDEEKKDKPKDNNKAQVKESNKGNIEGGKGKKNKGNKKCIIF